MKRTPKSRNTQADPNHVDADNRFETPTEPDHAANEMGDDEESSDLDEANLDDLDDRRWEVFILDDDDRDPLPDYGDFWMPD